jgi:hypothetical protein
MSETRNEVTIEAQRQALGDRMSGFVRKITQAPRFYDESIPRWRGPVCFAVSGMTRAQRDFVLRRLSQIAASAGVRTARRGCEYNFYVVLTPEPDKLLKRLYRLHRRVFDQAAGMPAIDHFVRPAKPEAARVWHNAVTLSRDAMPIGDDGGCGSIGVGDQSVQINCQYNASRLVNAAVSGFTLALVVIDTTSPKGVTLSQVADFAAIVGLADIDLDADIAHAPVSCACSPHPQMLPHPA